VGTALSRPDTSACAIAAIAPPVRSRSAVRRTRRLAVRADATAERAESGSRRRAGVKMQAADAFAITSAAAGLSVLFASLALLAYLDRAPIVYRLASVPRRRHSNTCRRSTIGALYPGRALTVIWSADRSPENCRRRLRSRPIILRRRPHRTVPRTLLSRQMYTRARCCVMDPSTRSAIPAAHRSGNCACRPSASLSRDRLRHDADETTQTHRHSLRRTRQKVWISRASIQTAAAGARTTPVEEVRKRTEGLSGS